MLALKSATLGQPNYTTPNVMTQSIARDTAPVVEISDFMDKRHLTHIAGPNVCGRNW